jgi:hypothetical protein
MKNIAIILLALFPLFAHGEEVCDTSKDPINADVEESPLKDKDYSEEEVIKTLEGLKIFFSKEDTGKYYIAENYMLIIKGGYLLRQAKLIKINLEKINRTKNPVEYSETKKEYEKAKIRYCMYRKSIFLYDW